MTDPVKEQLSASLDGELPEAELDLLLRQVQRDSELRGAMGRYALVGEVLRTKSSVHASSGFAAKVSAAIAAESVTQSQIAKPALKSTNRFSPATLRWLRPAGGAAVAASVAIAAVLALQPAVDPSSLDATVADAAVQEQSSVIDNDDSYTVPSSTPGQQIVPATRLTNYVVAHSEYSSPLGRRTISIGVISDDEPESTENIDDSSPLETVTLQP